MVGTRGQWWGQGVSEGFLEIPKVSWGLSQPPNVPFGLQDAVKIMAKDLVRTRRYVKKFITMRANVQAVSLKIQTLKSNNSMAQAMKATAEPTVVYCLCTHKVSFSSRPSLCKYWDCIMCYKQSIYDQSKCCSCFSSRCKEAVGCFQNMV